MFSLFGKKSGPDITDKVWMSTDAMEKGLAVWLQEYPNGIIAVWFRKDKAHLQSTLPEESRSRVVGTEQLTSADITGKTVLFAGHYPLHSAETALAEKLGIKKMLVHSSLNSPLFKHFGGDKIIEAARGMGMKENEAIEHFLVSNAISKTQNKIADKVTVELSAASEEEWMQRNLQA